MAEAVRVTIHASQFPEAVRKDLRRSLRTRKVNHKFHYDSIKQAQRWLELHQAYSPSRTDPDCMAVYELSFAAAAARIHGREAQVVGLGCGGGQKDARLLRHLGKKVKKLSYAPVDVSAAMVLTARQAALGSVASDHCFPIVCDLATMDDLPALLPAGPGPRIITFFGVIPNFEPKRILPRLSNLLQPGDLMLFSANLAPGLHYGEGVERVLPLYDNPPTREWLLAFLLDLGVSRDDGVIRFVIEHNRRTGLKRIAAYFRFERRRNLPIGTDEFEFCPGESIRLFFSYRYTPDLISKLLRRHGLQVLQEWITASGEEGVFLVALR